MSTPYSILTVPTFAARCLSASYTTKGGTICGRETQPIILPRDADFHIHSTILLHAINLRHRTDGFTSPLKEGVLRIFSPLKIRRLQLGLNLRTWVLMANTLPLDHEAARPRSYKQTNALSFPIKTFSPLHVTCPSHPIKF